MPGRFLLYAAAGANAGVQRLSRPSLLVMATYSVCDGVQAAALAESALHRRRRRRVAPCRARASRVARLRRTRGRRVYAGWPPPPATL